MSWAIIGIAPPVLGEGEVGLFCGVMLDGGCDVLEYSWYVSDGNLLDEHMANTKWNPPIVEIDTALSIVLTVTAKGTGQKATAGMVDTFKAHASYLVHKKVSDGKVDYPEPIIFGEELRSLILPHFIRKKKNE